MSQGREVEQGHLDDLMTLDGFYASQVLQQRGYGARSPKSQSSDRLDKEVTRALQSPPATPKLDGPMDPCSLKTKEGRMTEEQPPNPRFSRLSLWGTLRFIGVLNRQERPLLLIGLLCAIIAGLGIPVYVT